MTGATAVLLAVFAIGLTPPDTPVADAARRGDAEAVRELLRSGADVNAAHGDGMTALHWAAEQGDAELAVVLLYAGANTDAGTRIGRYTPLHVAARRRSVGVVRALLDAGSNPEARTTNSGATPLHLAAASGDATVVDMLLRAGVDPDARADAWGQTPLIFAAAGGRADVVRTLLEAGADPSIAAHSVDAAEAEAADRAADRRLAELLDEFKRQEGGGPGWQPTPSQVQAAVEAARQVQRKWPDLPTEAAEADDDPETTPPSDSVPASEVAADPESDSEDETEDEAEEEAEENAEEEAEPLSYAQMVGGWGGLTPLHHAIRQGHRASVLALLDGGADINQATLGDNTTPLLMAAVNGQFDLALLLLERGADPNVSSGAGAAPLFAVLERTWAPRASYAHPTEHQQQAASHLDVMRALLEAGADPNARLVSHLWYMEYTFGVLRGSGIDMQGATPFWRAAYALDVDAMRLLKDYGADPGIPTMKPPQRRRRPPVQEQQADSVGTSLADSAQAESSAVLDSAGAVEAPSVDVAASLTPADSTTIPGDSLAGVAANPTKANAEGESAEEEGTAGADEEEDQSGVPPVPVGGPAIYPIHAASGVGYGQSFAGNAHRYVPGNWLAAVKFLVEECGAEIDVRDANAYTALHHAASRGDNELIQYLVERGADVTVVSRKGQTTADMANGPIQRVSPYPATIALLESLGAKNNGNCVSC